MTLEDLPAVIAVGLVAIATLVIGSWGLRLSRTTSDFFVASRTVNPRLNASAIGGEYLSAASFLGVAGLLLTFGADMLWYPIGWTAGYLVLLALVAAPLRRSGAYTLPDFAEARLGSRGARAACSLLVVAIAWLYLVPQFQGAGLTLSAAVGAPTWVGPLVVGVVVLAGISSGGMRSITFVQAFQYWLKLTALLLPAAILLAVWAGDGAPAAAGGAADLAEWSSPLAGDGGGRGLYLTYSLILATFLGTMGLPHVVVRFYTNPDGPAARRTTLVVLGLLGLFYVIPPVYGALGRVYADELASSGRSDVLVLELPRLMIDGPMGDVLSGLVTAGAFAAFLSTSSGLSIAVAGVLGQDVFDRAFGRRLRGVAAFRLGAVVAVVVPLARRPGPAQPRRRPGRRPRVRGRRVDVLPAARPRHLVAPAHRRRRGGRAARRLPRLRQRGALGDGVPAHRRRGGPPRAARGVVRAARLRDDGRGQPGHPAAGAGPHPPVPGPAARPGAVRPRPR